MPSSRPKLYAYSTYATQAAIPPGSLPEMIWSDTADPFLYLRVDRGRITISPS